MEKVLCIGFACAQNECVHSKCYAEFIKQKQTHSVNDNTNLGSKIYQHQLSDGGRFPLRHSHSTSEKINDFCYRI